MIIQVHSEDYRGYINEHKQFSGENNISSEDNRYLDDYVMELVSRSETDKIVIRKFEDLDARRTLPLPKLRGRQSRNNRPKKPKEGTSRSFL